MGFLGNTILGWTFGKKGFIRAGLEGPRNKAVVFALLCFVVMMAWGSAAKLEPAFGGWRDAWPVVVAGAAYLLGRYLTPRSQRLFERAKFLHETTFVGDWRGPRSEREREDAFTHPRLVEAELLYVESAAIQERRRNEAVSAAVRDEHQRNIVVVHCQLSLLYLMMGDPSKALERARHAVHQSRELVEARRESANLNRLSEALYALAQAEHLSGNEAVALPAVQEALEIDLRLGNAQGAEATRNLIDEITRDANKDEDEDEQGP